MFGSFARGDMRPDSDVDLLLEFLPESRTGLIKHAAAERELADLFGRKVDLVSKRGLKKLIRDQVIS